MKPTKERRTGKERRVDPPFCSHPCEFIKGELEKVKVCINKKVPAQLYYWSFGGLCFFCIIVIGGFQWKILDNQKIMNISIEVVRTKVENISSIMNYHIKIDDARHLRNQDKIDELYKKNGWRNNREP